MGKLHPSLRESIKKLPKDKAVSLFTRHSLRELSSDTMVSYKLPLTDEGVALAKHWGGEINRPISGVYSSPVGRCVDTAKAMLEGAKQQAEVIIEPKLTEPGCFVQQLSKQVGKQFLQLGPVKFISQHFNEPWEGLLPLHEGSSQLIQQFHGRQGGVGSLSIHVTHDTILAPFIYYLMEFEYVDEQLWPWMLEGAFLWFDQHKIHWIWRGELHSRHLAPFLNCQK